MATSTFPPTESAPSGFLGFPVPNRPPDFQIPTPEEPASGVDSRQVTLKEGETRDTVWLPTPNEPGLVISQYWEHPSRRRAGDYPELRRVHLLGTLGMGPVLDAVGIQTAEYRSPTNPAIHTLEMTVPWPETFCRDADAAADAGLTHVRFAVSEPNHFFSTGELMRSLRKGRMLLSGLDLDEPDDWQQERQFYLFWHDLAYHAIGHLGLSREVAGRMFDRAKRRWYWPFGAHERADNLTGDMDTNIHIGSLVPTLLDPDHHSDLFRDFRPRRSKQTGAQLVRAHVQSLAAKAA